MERLKILLVSHGTIEKTSGLGKVHYELKEAYEALGHYVEVLDMKKLYPKGQTGWSKIFKKHFTWYIWQYLKQHAHRFDVIDANFECITYPKDSYHFKGVVMARSHGIMPFYIDSEKSTAFQQSLAKRQEPLRLKTRVGNLYRKLQKKSGLREFQLSLQYADILHCLNTDEYRYFIEKGVPESKIVLVPNGLLDNTIKNYSQVDKWVQKNTLAFVGSWTPRKGINDLEEIINAIQQQIKLDAVYLLGGGYTEEYVRSFFSPNNQKILQIVPYYANEEIVKYLQLCKLGIFPSYIEGFPMAIIEQLACGLPIVAYNIPGTKDVLSLIDDNLLIDTGDTGAFANEVINVLKSDAINYKALSAKALTVAAKYKLSNIAQKFISTYKGGVSS